MQNLFHRDGCDFSVMRLKYQECTSYLVINGSGNIQMSLATHHGLIVAAQQLQRVAEVAAGFRLSELIADCPWDFRKRTERKPTIRVQYKQSTQVYWCQNTRCKKSNLQLQATTAESRPPHLHFGGKIMRFRVWCSRQKSCRVITICCKDRKYNFEGKKKD